MASANFQPKHESCDESTDSFYKPSIKSEAFAAPTTGSMFAHYANDGAKLNPDWLQVAINTDQNYDMESLFAVASRSFGQDQQREQEISDKQLVTMSTREINTTLQAHDRKFVHAVKRRRRTLKNRVYALNCRVKRATIRAALEDEVKEQRLVIHHLRQEVDSLRRQLGQNLQTPCTRFDGATKSWKYVSSAGDVAVDSGPDPTMGIVPWLSNGVFTPSNGDF